MNASKQRILIALSMVAFATGTHAAYAQCNLAGSPVSTLRTPLIEGASNTAAYQMAPEGQPPAIGDGSCPIGTNPGHLGPPTLLPAVPLTPSNHINYPSVQIPFNPAQQSPPGMYGPSTWAPPPPSTPGYDPGMIDSPPDFYPPPVSVVHVNPGGGLSGWAPTQRWGGQTSTDFGRYKYEGKRAFDFGQQLWGQTSEDGPWSSPRSGAVPTQDLYGRRQPLRNGYGTTQTIAPY